MMEHTLRCLMLGGYQVDCHSRERYGYGGDGHSSLDTTLCLLRSDAFYRKWTRDWLDGQKGDGGLTYTSPASGHGGGPFWCGFLTAATLKHYHHYGDLSLVQRNYPAIKKWFELAQTIIESVEKTGRLVIAEGSQRQGERRGHHPSLYVLRAETGGRTRRRPGQDRRREQVPQLGRVPRQRDAQEVP